MVFKRRILRKVQELSTRVVKSGEYVSLEEDEKADYFSQAVERVTKTVKLSDLKKLYLIDPLTFRHVEKYVNKIVGQGFYWEGDPDYVRIVEEWCNRRRVQLKSILKYVIRDIFIGGGGNAWVELGYNRSGTDIVGLRMMNPTNIDYIRDSRDQNVILDENGDPVGFIQERGVTGERREWRKDYIKIGDQVVWRATRGQDGRDRIAHFYFWKFGDSYLGITPVQTSFKPAIIRLNLEENVGEGGYRSGSLIAYVGTDDNPNPPDALVDSVVEELEKANFKTVFGFKKSVKLDRMPSPDLTGREDLIYLFADLQSTAIGRPLILDMQSTTRRGYAGEAEMKNLEFQLDVEVLQDELARQVEEKLIYRLFKARGLPLDKIPKLRFRSALPSIQRERLRRLSMLARYGLLTREDPELEVRLRQELDLPFTLIKKKLDQILKEKAETADQETDQPESI